ncbi:MAG: hypothetical protein NTY12_02880 [Candidatus Falkowbacteria bacterium]|nr:hypothetical protein [Candidatus Falkowbacteria bacterium]
MKRLIYNLIYNILVVILAVSFIGVIDKPSPLMVYLVLTVLVLAIFAILRKLYHFIFVKDRWLFVKLASDIEKYLWGVTNNLYYNSLHLTIEELRKAANDKNERKINERHKEGQKNKALREHIEKCNR